MRISDWSSDVCSSDLLQAGLAAGFGLQVQHDRALVAVQVQVQVAHAGVAHGPHRAHVVAGGGFDLDHVGPQVAQYLRGIGPHDDRAQVQDARTEEHTYELQSLMRISYAVFYLKKKNITRL